MSTSGDIFKSIGRGFVAAGKDAGKSIIRGATPKPTIAKADIPSRRDKVSFFGATRNVVMGSKIPKAGIKADRSGWKKPQEKQSGVGAFIYNEKREYKRQQAADWIAQALQSGDLKDLRGRFYRYFKYLPRKSDPLAKKLALAEKIFGSTKEPLGPILQKKSDTPLHLAQRDRRFREKIIPKERAEKDWLGIEQEKINREILNRFFQGKK